MKHFKLFTIIVVVVSIIVTPFMAYAAKAVIVFGLDETGSYGLRNKGIGIASSTISSLKSGDVFYARRITDKSFADTSSVFRLSIPDAGTQPANKFDRKAYAKWQFKTNQASAVKRQAVEILRNLKPVKAPRTDIWGFLAAATSRFQAEGPDYSKRVVIIATDMKDNMKRKANVDLMGADIIIVGFQVGENPSNSQELQTKWTETLMKAHAGSVYFLPADSKFNFKR